MSQEDLGTVFGFILIYIVCLAELRLTFEVSQGLKKHLDRKYLKEHWGGMTEVFVAPLGWACFEIGFGIAFRIKMDALDAVANIAIVVGILQMAVCIRVLYWYCRSK